MKLQHIDRSMRVSTAFLSLVMVSSMANAQCDGCVPDLACSVDPAYPTLCPSAPPSATAGQPYSADITFWMPPNFTDPGTGFNVDFLLMTITSVSGLPYGLNIGYSEPTGIYHPQQSAYGCARICGTPVGAGSYTVTINIVAQVEYSGFTLNVPQQFPLTITVLPGTGGNTGFSFTPTSGCGTAEVEFIALIDGQGYPVTYAWDLGNGNTSDQPAVVQTYDQPGTYSISLQTTIGGYVLNAVSVGGVNDNWCGDVEEISLFGSCQGSPDIYFVLTDGLGNTYESSHGEDSGSESWGGLGLTLSTPPYAIEFWDEDPVSVDDALGTYNIPQNGEGLYNFNVAGGTFGSLTIDLVPQQVFNDTDTVVVFAAPQPVLTYDTASADLCCVVQDAVNITWFNDGDTVATGSLTCIPADSTGAWWAVVNNAFGCATTTDTIVVCPELTIEQSGDVLYTTTGLEDYQWSFEGAPIPGATGPFIIAESSGVYSVLAHDALGCELHSDYTLLSTLIASVSTYEGLSIRPNPSEGVFTVLSSGSGTIVVFDALGQEVGEAARALGGQLTEFDLGHHPPGVYLIQVITPSGTIRGRVVIRR